MKDKHAPSRPMGRKLTKVNWTRLSISKIAPEWVIKFTERAAPHPAFPPSARMLRLILRKRPRAEVESDSRCLEAQTKWVANTNKLNSSVSLISTHITHSDSIKRNFTFTWRRDAVVFPGCGIWGGIRWSDYRLLWSWSDIISFVVFGWCFVVRWLVAGGRASLQRNTRKEYLQ